MEKFLIVIMYMLWVASLVGVLVITFSGFQYMDLNLFVGILFLFTVINTFFTLQKKSTL